MPASSIISKGHPKSTLRPVLLAHTWNVCPLPPPRGALLPSACLRREPWGPLPLLPKSFQPPARLSGATSPGTLLPPSPPQRPCLPSAPTTCSRGRRAAWPLRGPRVLSRAPDRRLAWVPTPRSSSHASCVQRGCEETHVPPQAAGCPATPKPPVLMNPTSQKVPAPSPCPAGSLRRDTGATSA